MSAPHPGAQKRGEWVRVPHSPRCRFARPVAALPSALRWLSLAQPERAQGQGDSRPRVGMTGFDGDGGFAGAGRGRRPLVNPAPNHNCQRQRRRAGTGGLRAATRPGPLRAGLGAASFGADGGGSPAWRPLRSFVSVPAAGSAATPVAPASCCSSDPGSIPGISTTPLVVGSPADVPTGRVRASRSHAAPEARTPRYEVIH